MIDHYERASQAASRDVTTAFSTSFGLAIKLLPKTMRPDIYNIYGLVRIADEIVDTYRGIDAPELLDELEHETYAAIIRGYSPNVILHAFGITARKCDIDKDLIEPFFRSMRTDLSKSSYTQKEYADYIYGSAEVVGLMCLKVFCAGDSKRYGDLAPGAKLLGSAFQKVNFLRDLAADTQELQRMYFPGVAFDQLDEAGKQAIIKEIAAEFTAAEPYIKRLPNSSRPAVVTAYRYYKTLLAKIARTPVSVLRKKRVSVHNARKLAILSSGMVGGKLRLGSR